MEEMKQQVGSPELLPKEKKSKLPLILAILVLLLAAAYVGLCFWVSANSTILPNVQVGDTAVGGMTVAQAAQVIKSDADARFSPYQAEVEFDKTSVLFVSGDHITADGHAAAMEAYGVGRTDAFFLFGFHFLKSLAQPTILELPIIYNPDAPDIYAYLDNAFLGHEYALVQSAYTVGETEIQVHKGSPGLRYDREEAAQIIMQNIVDAAKYGQTPRTSIEPIRTEPDPIDWQALSQQVFVAPVDATLNPETGELIPSITGVSLNVYDAQRLYDQAGDGDSLTIPLTFTEPEMTTEKLEATLFQDVLGSAYSWISGVENRLSNVKFAGELCHGTIIMPGAEFSYWSKIDPCTAEQGFLPAPTYLNGKTVDGIGGGICQMSSSIYTAALQANLEILERRPHSYAVGYLPDGSDAMVSGGSSDFRFRNNTEHPIKIAVTVKGRNLTVQLLGTKTDDTYVKMQFVELSRTPFQVIYKIDNSIPAGTTKEEVSGYTGRKTEAYRCVYNGDGTQIGRAHV